MYFTHMPVFLPFLAEMTGNGDHQQMFTEANSIVPYWFNHNIMNEETLDIQAKYLKCRRKSRKLTAANQNCWKYIVIP